MTMQAPQSSPTPAASKPAKREPKPLNGVDTPTLFGTIDAVAGQPELAKFQFRATNRWQTGTHSRTTIETFSGAGGDHTHTCNVEFDADHPAVLCGKGQGITPVEFLLHALSGCLMAGVGNIAAARGVKLESVECRIEGNADLRGLLGIDKTVRNGFSDISVKFNIQGDAPADKLAAIIEQSKQRSAVFDVITNQVPVSIEVEAG